MEAEWERRDGLMYSEDENLSVLKNDIIMYSRHDLAVVREKHRNKLAAEYKRLHFKRLRFSLDSSFSLFPFFFLSFLSYTFFLILFSNAAISERKRVNNRNTYKYK